MEKNILQFLFTGKFTAKASIRKAAKHSVAAVPFSSVLNVKNMSRESFASFENMNVHLFGGINPQTFQNNQDASPLQIIDITFDPAAAGFETTNIPNLNGEFACGNDLRAFSALLQTSKNTQSLHDSGPAKASGPIVQLNKLKAAKQDQTHVLQEQIAVVVPEAELKLLSTDGANHPGNTDVRENLSQGNVPSSKAAQNNMPESSTTMKRRTLVSIGGSKLPGSKTQFDGAVPNLPAKTDGRVNSAKSWFSTQNDLNVTISKSDRADNMLRQAKSNSEIQTAPTTAKVARSKGISHDYHAAKLVPSTVKVQQAEIANAKPVEKSATSGAQPFLPGPGEEKVINASSTTQDRPQSTSDTLKTVAAKTEISPAKESGKMRQVPQASEKMKLNAKGTESAISTKRTTEGLATSVLHSSGKKEIAVVSDTHKFGLDRPIATPGESSASDTETLISRTKETDAIRPVYHDPGKNPVNAKTLESAHSNQRTAGEIVAESVLHSHKETKRMIVSDTNNPGQGRSISDSGKDKAFAAKAEVPRTKETAKVRPTFHASQGIRNVKIAEPVIQNRKTPAEKVRPAVSRPHSEKKAEVMSDPKKTAIMDGHSSGSDNVKSTNAKFATAGLKEKVVTKKSVDYSKKLQSFPEKNIVHKISDPVSTGKSGSSSSTFSTEDKAHPGNSHATQNQGVPDKRIDQDVTTESRKVIAGQKDVDKNVFQVQTTVSPAAVKSRIERVLQQRMGLQNASSVRATAAVSENDGQAVVNAPNDVSSSFRHSMKHHSNGSKKRESLLSKTASAPVGKHVDNALQPSGALDFLRAEQKLATAPVLPTMQNKPAPATLSALSAWIADGAKLMISHKESFLSVKAESDELGKLFIRMGHENKKIDITIHVQSEQSKMLLENSLPELRQHLAQKDMLLSDIRVLIHDKPERRFSGGSKFNDRKWREEKKRKAESNLAPLADHMAMNIRRIESLWSTYQAVA